MVGFVIDDDDVLLAAELTADPTYHFIGALGEWTVAAICQNRLCQFAGCNRLSLLERMEIGDEDARLLKPFEQFRDFLLPELMKGRAGKRTLRIWSAACSSGQEPYSLVMLLSERKEKLAGWQVEIIATDLSTEILEKAQAGIYTQFEVQRGMPIQMLVKYFKQEGERWRIDPGLASMVKFRYLNLLEDFAHLGQFDVVFLRNVLIYFDQPTKTTVLDRIARVLQPDGYLYLGGAETIIGITDKFQAAPDQQQRGVYCPVISASAMAKKLAAR